MKMDHSITYHRQPRVVSTPLGTGEFVLLHMATREYYALNETGTMIWDLLSSGSNPSDLTEAFVRRYDLSRDEADAEVRQYLDLLLAERLIITALDD